MATSRQHWVKQSMSAPQWNVKRSSRPILGQSFRMVRSAAMFLSGMGGLLFFRANTGFQRVLGPDRQGTVISRLGVQTEPVRSRHIVVIAHPGPAADVVWAFVVKADELEFAAPTARLGIRPAHEGRIAMRAIDMESWRHGQ